MCLSPIGLRQAPLLLGKHWLSSASFSPLSCTKAKYICRMNAFIPPPQGQLMATLKIWWRKERLKGHKIISMPLKRDAFLGYSPTPGKAIIPRGMALWSQVRQAGLLWGLFWGIESIFCILENVPDTRLLILLCVFFKKHWSAFLKIPQAFCLAWNIQIRCQFNFRYVL